MSTRKSFLSLLMLIGLAVVSCKKEVEIPITEICSVAGVMVAGMNCAYEGSEETREMTFEEMVEWLEPQPGTPTTPERGGAICQSIDDWSKKKTALDQLCIALGSACTREVREKIARVFQTVTRLEEKSIEDKKKLIHPIHRP